MEDETKIKEIDTLRKFGGILIALILRSFAATVWFTVYIALMWYFDLTSTLERIHGFSTLIVGFALVVTPKRSCKKDYWAYCYVLFLLMSGTFLFLA